MANQAHDQHLGTKTHHYRCPEDNKEPGMELFKTGSNVISTALLGFGRTNMEENERFQTAE
jgi:hypothetical protein